MNDRFHDERCMRRALELAGRAAGSVSPNPMVGAVLARSGRIIAEEWHRKFGGPHAEVRLLRRVKKTRAHRGLRRASLRGATLYLTLEPCIGFTGKKTPGCLPEILASGIRRVVVAMRDPNPAVAGRGIAALRKAGIEVSVGCLSREAKRLNEKFVTWMTLRRPFVTMKVAMSLDGKIATKTGDSKWITSEASRRRVKQLRDQHDAVLVGINTVLRDSPQLKGLRRQPQRIILDSRLRILPRAKVLRDANVLLATTELAPRARLDYFLKRDIPCKIFPRKNGLPSLLKYLARRGISSLLVEGGSEVFGAFVDARLVDRFAWFIAPVIIGGTGAKTAVGGQGVALLKQALRVNAPAIQMVGPDILFFASASHA